MASYLPLVFANGKDTVLAGGDSLRYFPRGIASPSVDDLTDGEMILDTDNSNMVLRLGSFLYRFKPDSQVQSYPSGWDFSDADNSIWIGDGF